MKKYSKQREWILKSLKQRTDHPTAEMLYSDLKKEVPEIGIATIYRNVNELVEEGDIIRIKSRSGKDRYDGNTMPHIHFECDSCLEIEDIFLYEEAIQQLDNEMKKLVKEIGAEATASSIIIKGYCKNCQLSKQKNKEEA